MLKTIMRIFSYVYHLILGLFLLVVGAIALTNGGISVRMQMLPWEDPATYWVFFGGLLGLVSLFLAITGKLRLLFRLWTVVVFGMMLWGFFLSQYPLNNTLWTATLLTLGALVAMLGSWTKPRHRRA